MIHIMLPPQYSSRTGVNVAEPHKRLMAAVLQAVVDDCRGSVYRRSAGKGALDARTVSFENRCEALGLDAGGLREELDVMRAPA